MLNFIVSFTSTVKHLPSYYIIRIHDTDLFGIAWVHVSTSLSPHAPHPVFGAWEQGYAFTTHESLISFRHNNSPVYATTFRMGLGQSCYN